MELKLLGSLLIIGIPALSVILVLIKKFFPEVAVWIKYSYSALTTVHNALDAIVKEYPDNPTLNSVEDILEQVVIEFEQAGYNSVKTDIVKAVAKKDLKKKEGFSVDLGLDKATVEYNKKF